VAITQKVFSSRSNNLDSATFVGEVGRLFYEQPAIVGVAPVLKYSDGSTPGGLPLSGSSLTFSSSTAPANPQEGNMWWNTTDGRLYIYYDSSWVDVSPNTTPAFPRLPNYDTDSAANTAIGGAPLLGQMYYDTTLDKAKVYTASGWQAMN
jgi:hypothetical protein